MIHKNELLPCPFCGGDAADNVHAENCYFTLHNDMAANSDLSQAPAVLKAWNRRAALAQQPAMAVPEGWALVPIKPSIEMVEAGYETSLGQPDRSGHARTIEVYDAMLAAAHAAPVAQEPIKLSDDVREFLQEWIDSTTGGEDGDVDYDFANQLAVLLGPIYTAPPAAERPVAVRVPVETLRRIHRDLDACQKVIWLAGCRPRGYGFDPAYVSDAQDRLKEIDALLAKEGTRHA